MPLSFSPASFSPSVPPEGISPPEVSEGLGMTQDEMRTSLQDLMDIVKEKYQELDSRRFELNNATDAARKKSLVAALRALEDAGVDVQDQESVQQFAAMLQEKNPELYAMFEEAFNTLLGDEFPVPGPEEFGEMPPFAGGEGEPGGMEGLMGSPMGSPMGQNQTEVPPFQQ